MSSFHYGVVWDETVLGVHWFRWKHTILQSTNENSIKKTNWERRRKWSEKIHPFQLPTLLIPRTATTLRINFFNLKCNKILKLRKKKNYRICTHRISFSRSCHPSPTPWTFYKWFLFAACLLIPLLQSS